MQTAPHGGNLQHLARMSGIPADRIVDFSASINALGPPDWLRSVVSSALGSVVHYPDPDCTELVQAAAQSYGVEPDQILLGNGSTELLHLIARATRTTIAAIPVPCYSDYFRACEAASLPVKTWPMQEAAGFRLDPDALDAALTGHETVFLCTPNNPTGLSVEATALRRLAERNASCLFVIDEAFGDFVEGFESLASDRPSNVVVLISLTKMFAIPGLRLGMAVASKPMALAVRGLQPPWSVNWLAQAVGEAALKDRAFVERSRRFVTEQRRLLAEDLEAIPGLYVYPGQANFLLVRVDRPGIDAAELARLLLRDGIAIRVADNFLGLDKRFFRVAVRTRDDNQRLCEALCRAMKIPSRIKHKSRVPAIMFQGTSSNAGKSVLTAAVGRILLQEGYSVAPFKAQNMSLNSFVTRDGREMGRAQVVQAQACRLDPDVRMNPILLKPNSDTGSQVILMGKPVANMDVAEYVRYKPQAFEEVKRAYDSLASEHDVMVLEGAGSPGEVNLKSHDIVNMEMARYAQAPVVIVGDIDRGGVFASFIGTMEVLSEPERRLVAGFLVNRFRGKADLLADAFDYTLRHTGKPVLGVIPYLKDLGLPEEDSVSFKSGLFPSVCLSEDCVEIAVIDLPHISNFTDFDALAIEPDVRITVVRDRRDLNQPDALIIPGSKNVVGDMTYLRDSGLDVRIADLSGIGKTEIIGICGGFQMLGTGIADPHGIESDGKTVPALGLLNLVTVLAREKTLTRAAGTHLESGLDVTGYEIHHGVTDSAECRPLAGLRSGTLDGAVSSDGMMWGTYLHGIFDSDGFRRWFVDRLRVRRGLGPKGKVCASYDLEPALDRLAQVVRAGLDVRKLMRIMGIA